MRRILARALGLAGLLALPLLALAARPLGGSAPDPLLAAGIAVAAARRETFSRTLLLLGVLRASLSIDPVLPTLGTFLLLGEGTSLAAGTFFGERAFVPGLAGALSAVVLPALLSVFPEGASPGSLGDLLVSALGTGALAALLSRFAFAPRRRRR